jgi:hypothetical protein
MYRIVYDEVKNSPAGLTTDEIAQRLGKSNHVVSARVAYLTCYGYLQYTSERRTTRNGCDAEVLVATRKPADKFHCPLRETQKGFLKRIVNLIETGAYQEAIESCQSRDEGLRR